MPNFNISFKGRKIGNLSVSDIVTTVEAGTIEEAVQILNSGYVEISNIRYLHNGLKKTYSSHLEKTNSL